MTFNFYQNKSFTIHTERLSTYNLTTPKRLKSQPKASMYLECVPANNIERLPEDSAELEIEWQTYRVQTKLVHKVITDINYSLPWRRYQQKLL